MCTSFPHRTPLTPPCSRTHFRQGSVAIPVFAATDSDDRKRLSYTILHDTRVRQARRLGRDTSACLRIHLAPPTRETTLAGVRHRLRYGYDEPPSLSVTPSNLQPLRIYHPLCIDTVFMYHHPRGRSLKSGLAWLTKMSPRDPDGGQGRTRPRRRCARLC